MSVEFDRLTVVTGPNGAGKSTLYRALELLRAAGEGDLSRLLAAEGGMESAVWAGPRRKEPVRIRFRLNVDGVEYALALGVPRPTDAALALDPVVKEETVSLRHRGRRVQMMVREGPLLRARDAEGRRAAVSDDLWLFQTALSSLIEPERYPELSLLRRRLLDARFYHQFRADPDSPLRRPHPKIASPSVDSDGANWAAALFSRIEIAESWADLDRSAPALAIAAGFPGASPAFFDEGAALEAGLKVPEFQRPFRARELSDGTLRYLALTAALTALRPPSFIALNEPEASLHPDLLPPLADLIARAAEKSQILVVTHSAMLADRLEVEHAARRLRLDRVDGETRSA